MLDIGFAKKTFDSCQISSVERWDLDGWTLNTEIRSKIKGKDKIAVGIYNTWHLKHTSGNTHIISKSGVVIQIIWNLS